MAKFSHSLMNEAVWESQFPSFALVARDNRLRSLAKAMFILLLLGIVLLMRVPWQQSVKGAGRVVSYHPNQRTQEVDAPISGRIVDVREGLVEGTRVRKGELLMRVELVDTILFTQMQTQMVAAERKLQASQQVVMAQRMLVETMREVREQTELAAKELVNMANHKLNGEQETVRAAQAEYEQSEKDRVRRFDLFQKKLESKYEWEVAERKAAESKAKLEKAKAYVLAAESELSAKRAEMDYKIQEANSKIDKARADYEKAMGDAASAEKDVAELTSKQTLQSQDVVAPLDGYVLRLKGFQGGQIVSAGQPLLELVPAAADQAVEIKVDGNDAPLVATKDAAGESRKVRLQFEGWPAVQFAGWPSVAVGTFGGVVSVVDSTDDGRGKFRVLVVPDPADRHRWPSPEILRQGVRANGWILLNEVPLGIELWRQFNGFPPAIAISEIEKDEKLLRSGKK